MLKVWCFQPYFQPEPLSDILTIANFRQAATRVWTCAEPVLRLRVSVTVLSERFVATGVFYLSLLRLWLRCKQEHPFRDLPLCLPPQSCPLRLTHELELLMFELHQWPTSIELKLSYRICFASSKSYEKTIKTLWTRLDVLLKTASVNIFSQALYKIINV